MSECSYEGMFILDPNKYAREASELAARIPKLIEKQGGTVLVSRLWEERRLAYPIQGHRKGSYWLTYFRMDSQKLAALTEQVQRTDAVLRHLILKVDARIIDALVAHAASGSLRPATTTPAAVADVVVPEIDDIDGAAVAEEASA
ncbi:MAG: 30S ribosomal protein S6 [Planctomycetia bacterium]|nr:30S ribosomal protein S6 [Planctomycetia bacterium]